MRVVLGFLIFGLYLVAQADMSGNDVTMVPSGSAAVTPGMSGVKFSCESFQVTQIRRDMVSYLKELGIDDRDVIVTEPNEETIIYTLATPESDTDTLDFKSRRKYRIKDEVLILPTMANKTRMVKTVSRKEILLSLFQHGRLTEFAGSACTIDALREHIGLRQNVVAWVEKLFWHWPNGGSAKWNIKYWNRGTPLATSDVGAAMLDAFVHQNKYSFGCYTATKLSYAHGVLDYYARIKKDPAKALLVRERLMQDGDPLVGIEPGGMWSFEKDYDPADSDVPGKLLKLKRGVASDNFVPGDWSYLLNTDAMTYEKPGYEGSNAVYLGRGKFDDYYNDNHHAYTFREKLDEVYQWRNGVFSRSRDYKKIKPLTKNDYLTLSRTPQQGGLLEDFRVEPYFFGFEELP
jgi:hypothetical protein